jgi:hypothetical protein
MAAGECTCPKIQLDDWRDREVTLAGHSFLSCPTPLFFHVPRRFYRDLESLQAQVDGVRYRSAGSPLVLHRDGWFSGEILLSIEPGSTSGQRTFHNLLYSRVVERPGFDGALRAMPGFYRDLRRSGAGRIESMYFWYLNCPRCLIERGVGGVILLAYSARRFASRPCPAAAPV